EVQRTADDVVAQSDEQIRVVEGNPREREAGGQAEIQPALKRISRTDHLAQVIELVPNGRRDCPAIERFDRLQHLDRPVLQHLDQKGGARGQPSRARRAIRTYWTLKSATNGRWSESSVYGTNALVGVTRHALSNARKM